MDTIRSFRIVFPAFVLWGMVLFAKWLDHSLIDDMKGLEPHVLTAIAGLIAASLIPLGFAIGGLAFLVQLVLFAPFKDFQQVLDKKTVAELWKKLHLVGSATDRKDALYGSQVFFHQLDQWAVDYLNRLWDSANGYAGALIALGLSYAILRFAKISPSHEWCIVLFALAAIFGAMVWRNRREMRRLMIYHLKRRV